MATECCEPQPQAAGACHPVNACHGEAVSKPRPDWFLYLCLGAIAVLYGAGQLYPGAAQGSAVQMLAGSVVELFNKMWWGLALGVFFVGLLARIPRDLVMSVLGHRKGFKSLLRATLAGVLLDLCSHGILAVGMKLYERGASVGQVMAFLLASPWNSFSLTLILMGLIGVGWTLLFLLLSLLIGLLSGTIFDHFVSRKILPENPWREHLDETADSALLWSEFRTGWSFSAVGLGNLLLDGVRGSRVVIRWALFGILLASLLRVLVPEDAFATWFGASIAGLGLTLLAATVIEVCSEGATPLAADLMNRAAAPGNSFTFLMAGVATDYTEIMSIRETASSWKIALFLPLVSVPQILVLGFILNHF